MKGLTLAWVIGLAAAPVSAQIPVQKVGAPPFVEIRSQIVKTAGGELLGLVDDDLTIPVRGESLIVSGLDSSHKTVCVAVRHASGAYSASFTVRRAALGTTLRFVLPPNHIAKLQATRGELAILARGSNTGTCGRTDPVLLASWGERQPSRQGFALINDHQALRTQVVTPGHPPVRCRRLAAPTLTAYQVSCPIEFTGACGPATLTVQFIDGTSQTTLRTPFRRPC